MNSAIPKYILVFLLGGLAAKFLIPVSESIPENLLNPVCATNAQAVDPSVTIASTETIHSDTPEKAENHVLSCDEQTSQLEEELAQVELANTQIKKGMKDKMLEIATENAMLKHKISRLEPSNFDDEVLKKLVPAPHNRSLTMLPDNIKQEILDLHQQENDPNWGYIKQQQLTDFITTHVNFEYVNLTSVMCKINQCEVILDEKINKNTLEQQGLTTEEIKEVEETQEPKYKAIFDEIRINPELNLRTGTYMPNRFGIYMQLKDKSVKN
jgi:hypothetical protein